MARVRVVVHSTDPMTYVGLTSYLRSRPEMVIVDQDEASHADVAVFSTERLTSEAMNRLRALSAERTVPTVVMASELTEAPLLKSPDYSKPFTVTCDASSIALGAVLSQDDKPVAFLSKTFSSQEQNWIIYEKELFADLYTL